MNIQAMMKQAQAMQKDMLKAKDEIDKTIYNGKSNFVSVELYGTKKVKSISIENDAIESSEDIELLQDLLVVAFNEAIDKIDKDTEEKLGKYTKGMPGLF